MSPIVDKVDDFLTKLDSYPAKNSPLGRNCRVPLLPINHTSPSVYSCRIVRKMTFVCLNLRWRSGELGATCFGPLPKM